MSPKASLFLALIILATALPLSTGAAEICRNRRQDVVAQVQRLLTAVLDGCCEGDANLCRSEQAAQALLSSALEEHASAFTAAAAGSRKDHGKQTGLVDAMPWRRQECGDGDIWETVCGSTRQQAAYTVPHHNYHPQEPPHTDQGEAAQTCHMPPSSEPAAPSSAFPHRTWAVLARRSLLAALFAFSLAILLTVRHIDDAPCWFLHCIAWALSVPVMQLQRERPSRVLKYLMDVYLSSRSYSKMLLLSILTGTLIAYGGIALYAVAPEDEWEAQGPEESGDASEDGKTSLSEAMWAAAAGAGFDWAFFPSSSNAVRVVSLIIAVCGSFITAALLTLVSDALGKKVDELKSGRGAVLESGHLLILGWSERVFSLLEQLALGCELSGGATVVILSDQNKEKCLHEIWSRGIDMKKNRLVIREGSIFSELELQKVCAPLARSILILTDPQDWGSDARTLRCLLCLQNANPAVSEGVMTAGVLAEMCHADQADLLMQLAGEDRVRTVCSPGLMGRLMVQCTRYPRLLEVLQEIVGFEGSETYIFTNTQPLVGMPFGFLQSAFEHAVPLGLCKAQSDTPLELNPPYDELVEEGDHIILLAEDEASLGLCNDKALAGLHKEAKKEVTKLHKQPQSNSSRHRFQSFRQWQRSLPEPEASKPEAPSKAKDSAQGGGFCGRFLFIGWRRDIVSMIRQLDSFLTGPSVLFLYSNKPLADRRQLLIQSGLEFSLEEGGLQPLSLTHLRLRYNEPWLVGEAALKSQIQVLYPLQFKAVLILAQDSPLSIADADSRTIAALMNLRQVQVEDLRTGRTPPDDHPLHNAATSHPHETLPTSRHTSGQSLPQHPDLAWLQKSGYPRGSGGYLWPPGSNSNPGAQPGRFQALPRAESTREAETIREAEAKATHAAEAKSTHEAEAQSTHELAEATREAEAKGTQEAEATHEAEACAKSTLEAEGAALAESGTAESAKDGSASDEEPPQGPAEAAPLLHKPSLHHVSSLLSVAAKLKVKRRLQRERCSGKEAARCQGGQSEGVADVTDSGAEEHTKWEDQLRELQMVIQKCVVVTELLDKSASALLHGLELSVRVLPNNLVAQIMALTMLSFERIDILEHLFHPDGNMLYVRPRSWLMPAHEDEGVNTSFMKLARMSMLQGEVLLGYIEKGGTMKLNPERKSDACLSRSNVESFVTVSCEDTQL